MRAYSMVHYQVRVRRRKHENATSSFKDITFVSDLTGSRTKLDSSYVHLESSRGFALQSDNEFERVALYITPSCDTHHPHRIALVSRLKRGTSCFCRKKIVQTL